MTMTLTLQLAELADTLRSLPEAACADVLAEIEAKVQNLNHSRMSQDQRAVVKQRLSQPRKYVSAAEVETLLRRFDPAP